jgi:hypothetical protein
MTKAEMLAALDREIALRRSVYPGRVQRKFMSQAKATHEIDAMIAIRGVVATYAPGDDSPPPQPSLF